MFRPPPSQLAIASQFDVDLYREQSAMLLPPPPPPVTTIWNVSDRSDVLQVPPSAVTVLHHVGDGEFGAVFVGEMSVTVGNSQRHHQKPPRMVIVKTLQTVAGSVDQVI